MSGRSPSAVSKVCAVQDVLQEGEFLVDPPLFNLTGDTEMD